MPLGLSHQGLIGTMEAFPYLKPIWAPEADLWRVSNKTSGHALPEAVARAGRCDPAASVMAYLRPQMQPLHLSFHNCLTRSIQGFVPGWETPASLALLNPGQLFRQVAHLPTSFRSPVESELTARPGIPW